MLIPELITLVETLLTTSGISSNRQESAKFSAKLEIQPDLKAALEFLHVECLLLKNTEPTFYSALNTQLLADPTTHDLWQQISTQALRICELIDSEQQLICQHLPDVQVLTANDFAAITDPAIRLLLQPAFPLNKPTPSLVYIVASDHKLVTEFRTALQTGQYGEEFVGTSGFAWPVLLRLLIDQFISFDQFRTLLFIAYFEDWLCALQDRSIDLKDCERIPATLQTEDILTDDFQLTSTGVALMKQFQLDQNPEQRDKFIQFLRERQSRHFASDYRTNVISFDHNLAVLLLKSRIIISYLDSIKQDNLLIDDPAILQLLQFVIALNQQDPDNPEWDQLLTDLEQPETIEYFHFNFDRYGLRMLQALLAIDQKIHQTALAMINGRLSWILPSDVLLSLYLEFNNLSPANNTNQIIYCDVLGPISGNQMVEAAQLKMRLGSIYAPGLPFPRVAHEKLTPPWLYSKAHDSNYHRRILGLFPKDVLQFCIELVGQMQAAMIDKKTKNSSEIWRLVDLEHEPTNPNLLRRIIRKCYPNIKQQPSFVFVLIKLIQHSKFASEITPLLKHYINDGSMVIDQLQNNLRQWLNQTPNNTTLASVGYLLDFYYLFSDIKTLLTAVACYTDLVVVRWQKQVTTTSNARYLMPWLIINDERYDFTTAKNAQQALTKLNDDLPQLIEDYLRDKRPVNWWRLLIETVRDIYQQVTTLQNPHYVAFNCWVALWLSRETQDFASQFNEINRIVTDPTLVKLDLTDLYIEKLRDALVKIRKQYGNYKLITLIDETLASTADEAIKTKLKKILAPVRRHSDLASALAELHHSKRALHNVSLEFEQALDCALLHSKTTSHEWLAVRNAIVVAPQQLAIAAAPALTVSCTVRV